jgi:hypothetical protein
MASDLSFNIIALDKASATFLKLAEQLDHVSERLDRLDGKNVDVDVKVKTDESSAALTGLSAQFQLITAGIVAGAPLIGAAIEAGIGVGFIGVAAMAQKSNKDVQDAYTGLWHNVVIGAKNATDQLVPQIVGAAHAMDTEFQKLGPGIANAMSFAGPDIVALTRGIDNLAHNAMPGIDSAMSNSLPIFGGVAATLGTLGTAFGATVQSVGQHSAVYSTDLQSIGNITSSALGAATTIVNDLGIAWAANSTQIDSAISGVGTTISGLADGVLPVLSLTLGTAATAINTITSVLGPVAPILGTTAAAAAVLWGAFKVADLAATGVKSLASGVVTLGGNMEAGAAKGAVMIASMEGVAVESSVAAGAMRAAGTATATAAVGFGAATEAIAGGLGIALVAGTVLLGLFANGENDAKTSASGLQTAVDSLTSAFESSHGALNKQVLDSLQSTEAYKSAAKASADFGVSQSQLTGAVVAGGPALDDLRSKLQGVVAEHTHIAQVQNKGNSEFPDSVKRTTETLDAQGVAAKRALDALNQTVEAYKQGKATGDALNAAQQNVGRTLIGTAEFQGAASTAAQTLGLSLGDVTTGFQNVIATGGSASSSVSDVSAGFIKSALGVAQAGTAISDHFAAADKAVVTSTQGVADANASYQKSLQSIADAQHSYIQSQGAVAQANQGVADAAHSVAAAQRSLGDAYQGVTTAEQSYSRAQQQELRDQVALNLAREQAIEDLKTMHLQLEDQVVSEESARLRLFDQQNTALGFGVTTTNAPEIAAQQITAANEAQVKAAIDLMSAQNALNNVLNSGANLRKNVAAADAAGVEGSKGVVSAQDALRNAQDQVNSSSQALTKAHQQVADAAYGLESANRALTKAHQGVTDAAYNEQKAQLAVRDAQDASNRSAVQLQTAKQALSDAIAADSRTLDINTKAGQTNLTLLQALWTAISTTGGDAQAHYNTLVDATATAFGSSRDAAIDYLKHVNQIPQDFKYGITAMANVDTSGLSGLWQSILGAPPSGQQSGMTLGQLMGVPGHADGGSIGGVGGPKDDANLIWASKNEFMQPVDSVEHYGVGFMEAVRTKQYPKGGDGAVLPGFADGGLIGAYVKTGIAGANYQANVNALQVMGFPHPPPLPAYVPPPPSAGISFGGGPNGVIPTGDHLSMIDAALAADGIARADWPRWEAGMTVLSERESRWNPKSLNTWDSNAMAGHPSGGLTQTIASTYAGNRNPGLVNDMFDPVSNIAASINYIRRTYGDISQVQQANPNLPHKGYATGGLITPNGYDKGGWLMPGGGGVNGLSKPEAVLTPDESAAYVQQAKAAAAGGAGGSFTGTLVLDSGELLGVVRGQIKRLERESGVL